jgi:hypothetical protein
VSLASGLSSPSELHLTELAASLDAAHWASQCAWMPGTVIAATGIAVRIACSGHSARPKRERSWLVGAGGGPRSSPLRSAAAPAERNLQLLRLEPERAAIVDRHLVSGGNRRRRNQIERVPCQIAPHPRIRPARMIAQRDQTQRHCAAPRSVGITIPLEVIVVQNCSVEQRALVGRHDDRVRPRSGCPR